jgi:hypothetical protein
MRPGVVAIRKTDRAGGAARHAIAWRARRARRPASGAQLFRTGVTFTMFTLVVFTLVIGATTSGAFVNTFDDVEAFGGGFDVRADTAPANPIR